MKSLASFPTKNNKIRILSMGNLCSIYHAHFDKLVTLTNSHNKAVFLDKCLFWWQISKYTLGDEKIWFTRSIENIANELTLSISTINRYLNEFRKKGLIETKNKLLNKKHLYIRITDKLLLLISQNKGNTPVVNNIEDITDDKKENPKCIFLAQHDIIENLNLNVSIYKDKDINILVNNNTVSQPLAVNNLNPKTYLKFNYPTFPIETIIGERLSTKEKNYIKGMMHNLQKQNGVSLSSPEQLFAEIVFTILNEEQLQGINNFNHRVQIIAKLLREKRWLTPKGFFNHADFGAPFRKAPSKTDKQINSSNTTSKPHATPTCKIQVEHQKTMLKNKFNEHCRLIASETEALKRAAQQFKHNLGSIHLVHSVTATLTAHYTQQIIIQDEIIKLEKAINTKSPLFENLSIKNTMNNLALLTHQEGQLRQLVTSLFDLFCDASQLGLNKEEIDKTYAYYELLGKLHETIEKKIRSLEEQFDCDYVA